MRGVAPPGVEGARTLHGSVGWYIADHPAQVFLSVPAQFSHQHAKGLRELGIAFQVHRLKRPFWIGEHQRQLRQTQLEGNVALAGRGDRFDLARCGDQQRDHQWYRVDAYALAGMHHEHVECPAVLG